MQADQRTGQTGEAIERIEQRLFERYLSSELAGNEGPLTHIDASELALREALGPLAGDRAPLQALVDACGPPATAASIYAGTTSADALPSPDAFRYLVLACALHAHEDPARGKLDFRKRLAALFDAQADFNRLYGLPTLWHRLQRRMEARRARGERVRKIVLTPGIPSSPWLGMTDAMTFPRWRDARTFRDRLKALSARDGEQPIERWLPELARQVTEEASLSGSMKAVAASYLRAVDQARPALHSHRFHRLAARVALGLSEMTDRDIGRQLRFRLCIDPLEGKAMLETFWERDGKAVEPADEALPGGEVGATLGRLVARRADLGKASPSLRALEAGYLLLEPEGHGVLIDRVPGAEEPGSSLAIVAEREARYVRSAGIALEPLAPGWLWTKLLPRAQLDAVLRLPALNASREASRLSVQLVRPIGGVRGPNGTFLGREGLLPRIVAPPGARLSIEAAAGPSPLRLVPDARADEQDPSHRLSCPGSIAGYHRVLAWLDEEVALGTGITFRNSATPVVPAEPASGGYARAPGTRPNPDRSIPGPGSRAPTGDDDGASPVSALDDLIEAICFRAHLKSGLSAPEVLGWAEDSLGADGPHGWDVLHALEVSGVLSRWQSASWRATRWYARPLTGVRLGTAENGAVTVMVDGACGLQARRILRARAGRSRDARYGCLPRVSAYAPTRPLIVLPSADAIAEWPEMERLRAPAPEPLTAPACWPETAFGTDQREVWQRWRFDLGRMYRGASDGDGPVSLHVYRRDDRPDVYRVASADRRVPDRRLTDRTMAIAEAYRRAALPFLERRGELLVCTTRDGRLPVGFARALEMHAGMASGPVRLGGAWGYAYPASAAGMAMLVRCFGAPFVGQRTAPPDERLARLALGRRAPRAALAPSIASAWLAERLGRRFDPPKERR